MRNGLRLRAAVGFAAGVSEAMFELHRLLDVDYDAARLRELLGQGIDANEPSETGEPPILIAARRRRCEAVHILVRHGCDLDRTGPHGKTAWVHAVRRGFFEVGRILEEAGARIELNSADRLAVALSRGNLDEALSLLEADPSAARTGNPEEDRLLADLAGRPATPPVALLIDAGADLETGGLDAGTPLHQAAWFGQPANARILLDAGAPLDVFDPVHDSSPLHWAVHGSRFSGGADRRQDVYVELTRMLLSAGSGVRYPRRLAAAASRSYSERMLADATPAVEAVLREYGVTE